MNSSNKIVNENSFNYYLQTKSSKLEWDVQKIVEERIKNRNKVRETFFCGFANKHNNSQYSDSWKNASCLQEFNQQANKLDD